MTEPMTLGELAEVLDYGPWGCACTGPPPGERLCACALFRREATPLQRGAHIAVKLIADYAAKRAEDARMSA